MKKALLIIDVQNDYFPGGKFELVEADQALGATKKLINKFRENNDPIFYVQHLSDSDGEFFIPNTKGCEIHEEITPLERDEVIIKYYPNSFLGTHLQETLQKNEIQELVVCGIMTHMCVDTTVRAAQDYGYQLTLIADGCATRDLERNGTIISAAIVQETYFASLDGIFAAVMTSKEYLQEQ